MHGVLDQFPIVHGFDIVALDARIHVREHAQFLERQARLAVGGGVGLAVGEHALAQAEGQPDEGAREDQAHVLLGEFHADSVLSKDPVKRKISC